tara:strand:- start:718 stop:1368 length:651 start_codon:yes stop_codon:yes gene_type:complete
MAIVYQDKYVKDVYNQIANHFTVTRVNNWLWITQFINEIKDKNLGSKPLIYDIGCGSGRNMKYLDCDFIGIDNCKNFIEICRRQNLNVIESDITNISLNDDTADAIICIAAFHHLENDENRIKCLIELKRLIKTDGKILLSVWSMNQPEKTRRKFKDYGDNIVLWNNRGKVYSRYYYIFKISELLELFEKVGLKCINHYYDCGNEIFILDKEKNEN